MILGSLCNQILSGCCVRGIIGTLMHLYTSKYLRWNTCWYREFTFLFQDLDQHTIIFCEYLWVLTLELDIEIHIENNDCGQENLTQENFLKLVIVGKPKRGWIKRYRWFWKNYIILYNVEMVNERVQYQTAPNVKHYYVYFEVSGGHISTRVDLFAQMESRITCPKYTSQTTQTTSQQCPII